MTNPCIECAVDKVAEKSSIERMAAQASGGAQRIASAPRVLFLVDSLYSSRGGTEQHLMWLLRQICCFGCPAELIVLSRIHDEASFEWSVPVTVLGQSGRSKMLAWWKRVESVRRAIRERDYDIIHTMCPVSELVGICATMASSASSVRIIGSRRNLGYNLNVRQAWQSWGASHLIWRYVANSEAAKWASATREGIPAARIEVISNPLLLERVSAGQCQLVPRCRIASEGELLIAMVATVRPVKDYPTFLHAAQLVAQQHKNVRFLAIGEFSREIDPLTVLTDKLGLKNRFIWYGGVDNPFTILPHVDVAVLSSSSESFSNAVLEYSAAGVPSVVTDVGALREIVRHDRTGYVVPPGNPSELAKGILTLIEDPAKRRRFGDAAKRHVSQQFSEEVVARKYESLYYRAKMATSEAG